MSLATKITTEFGSAIQGMFVTWEHTVDPSPVVPLKRNGVCVPTAANTNCQMKMTIQLNLYAMNLRTDKDLSVAGTGVLNP